MKSKDTTKLIIVSCVLVFIVYFRFFYITAYPISVQRTVASAGGVFVLRFPQSEVERQEQLIIRGARRADGNTDSIKSIVRVPTDSINENKEALAVSITPEIITMILDIRSNWCKNSPTFHTLQENEPYYEVGLYCDEDPFFKAHGIKIPVDQLPKEFIDLIHFVPSPTCRDPMCGWE